MSSRKPTRIQKERRFLVLFCLACFLGAMFILVRQAQALPRQWLSDALCVYQHERGPSGWSTNTGNGYYGGLQMDLSFQRIYGTWLLRNRGTADRWTPTQQLRIAYRAHRGWKDYDGRGWSPWPNSARRCGLL